MAVPKDHLRRFHGMDDAKEIWAAIKTSLEKGYDRFQKILSQLDALGASVSDEDANPSFLRSYLLPWRQFSHDNKNERRILTQELSIDELYILKPLQASLKPKPQLRNYSSIPLPLQSKHQLLHRLRSHMKTGRRPRVDGKMHVAFDKRKVECFELAHRILDIFAKEMASLKSSKEVDGELETVSDTSSTHYSTCQSNDSDGELGTVTDHSVNDDLVHDQIPIPSIEQVTIATQKTQPQVPKPTQTVDPSCAQHVKPPRQPIKTPVTSSPIPSNNRQNWNQRMQRNLGKLLLRAKGPVNVRPNLSTASNTIKTGRVNVNTGHGNVNSGSVHVNAGTQVKSGASRFNTGKQHVNSGSVRVNSVTQFKSGASRFNTGKQHINSGCVNINTARVNRPVSNRTSPKPSQVNFNSQNKCFSKQSSPVNRPFSRKTAHESNKYAVKGKMGTAVKTSAGCVWRKITPLSNTNSGPTPDSNVNDHPLKHMEHRGIFDSGCSGHMTGNRAHLEDYQELSKVGSVTFGGSKGSISGKEGQDQEVPSQTDQGNTFATPEKSKGSGEAQEEQIRSQAPLGARFTRRKPKSKPTPTKILHFEEPDETQVNTGSTPSAQVNTAEVNTAELNAGSTALAQVNTAEDNTAELNTGETERVQRRKGKDPMTEEDLQAEVQSSKKSKEHSRLAD
ncbi:hypothetical protein Tco_1275463 [Tanacetum coccineum]